MLHRAQHRSASRLVLYKCTGILRRTLGVPSGFPEPVAAAIAYGLNKPEEAETILVVDLGGGTLDLSILESFEGIIEVATDNHTLIFDARIL